MNIQKLKEAEQIFLDRYPGGFDHPDMLMIAKKHKPEKMKTLARESFAEKLGKWTLMTIIPVYFKSHFEVYVKPTTAKNVIAYFEIENLIYKAKPTFDFYKGYRDIIHEMKDHVDDSLSPDNAAFTGFLMMSSQSR